MHSAKGNVKEGVRPSHSKLSLLLIRQHYFWQLGSVTGSENLRSSGQQEHLQGQSEYDAARTKGYAEGTQDRIGGKKDSVVGSVTGDRTQQAQGMSPP